MTGIAPCLLLAFFPLLPAGTETLDKAQRALEAFRVDDGMALLEQARRGGPYSLSDHARLYEQLAIANAYLERKQAALQAFDMLLVLDPSRVLRYTLSPRVTLLFEEARRRARGQPGMLIELSWPRDRTVADPIPITVEVLADRRQLLHSAAVFWRTDRAAAYRRAVIDLPGSRRAARRAQLPPIAATAQRAVTLEFYLVAYDSRGNEVYHWHDARSPRELVLRYVPRQPWYKKWWVWAIAGGLVAAGVSAATTAATWEPGTRVDARARVIR